MPYKAAQQVWLLSSAKIRQLVNFFHVRKRFFDQAIAPFAFVSFEPSASLPWDHHFVYTSARLTPAVEQLRAVMLTKADRRVVNQLELAHKDYLWKTYWWGSHRDGALVARLEIEVSLEDVLNQIDSSPGYGFQRGGSKTPSVSLQTLRPLKSRKVKWRLPSLPDWQAKVIVAIFWSSLGRYRLFMTSSNWGTWHDKIVSWDILSMPIRLPQQNNGSSGICSQICHS